MFSLLLLPFFISISHFFGLLHFFWLLFHWGICLYLDYPSLTREHVAYNTYEQTQIHTRAYIYANFIFILLITFDILRNIFSMRLFFHKTANLEIAKVWTNKQTNHPNRSVSIVEAIGCLFRFSFDVAAVEHYFDIFERNNGQKWFGPITVQQNTHLLRQKAFVKDFICVRWVCICAVYCFSCFCEFFTVDLLLFSL